MVYFCHYIQEDIHMTVQYNKPRRNEFVVMPILDHICKTLKVDYPDIVAHVEGEIEHD